MMELIDSLMDNLNDDLGVNKNVLYDVVSKYTNTIFVDLGVREGVSSKIMLIDFILKSIINKFIIIIILIYKFFL